VLLEELARHESKTKLDLARTGSKLASELAATAEVKNARNALDITRMAALLHGWKSQDEKITISHSQVILTKADITELQQLHRQALLKAGTESDNSSSDTRS